MKSLNKQEMKFLKKVGNFSYINLNTNSRREGIVDEVIGKVLPNLNKLGLIEIECPISKIKIQCSPQEVNSIRPIVLYKYTFRKPNHTEDIKVHSYLYIYKEKENVINTPMPGAEESYYLHECGSLHTVY